MRILSVLLMLCFSFSYGITLDELINLALKNSPTVKKKKIEMQIQSLNKKISKSQRFGDISLYGNITRYEDKRILYPLSPPVDVKQLKGAQNQIIVGASYKLPVFTGFKLRENVNISKLKEKLRKIDFELTKEQIIYNVKTIYLKVLSLQKQKKAIDSYIHSLKVLEENINTGVELGKKAEADLLKVKYSLKSAIAQREEIINSIKDLKESLKVIVGVDGLDLSDMQDVELTNNFNTDLNMSVIDSLRKLQQSKLLSQIEKRKLRISKGSYLPQISFVASVQRNMGADDYKDLYQIGLLLEWTVFDFGKRKNQLLISKLNVKKAQINEKQIKLELQKEIKTAQNRIKTAQQYIQAGKEKIKYALFVEQSEKAKYEEGVSDLYNYLYAKAQKLQAESELQHWLYEREIAITYLQYLLERLR